MEYISGISLADAMEQADIPLEESRVRKYAFQIAEALSFIHSLNPSIINCDIKPSNIILTSCDWVYIIDFSAAKFYEPNNKQDSIVMGTKGYAPPEQCLGKADPRSDIYSLGMTMYSLLTKTFPYEEDFEIKPLSQVNPSISKELEYIVSKCIENNSDNRYQSVIGLMYDLEHMHDIC